jgi:Secretion system C-terminal sorting domain
MAITHAQDPAYPPAPAAPQNIIKAEYFFDIDPGFGNGSNIPVAPGVDINNTPAAINTTGLSNGTHRLYIRTKSNEGRWSLTNVKDFVVDFNPAYPAIPVAPLNIIKAEYFIDTDPGFGNGSNIPVTPGITISNTPATINTTGLSNGVHRLYIRTGSNEGRWSVTNIKDFIVSEDPAYPAIPAAPGNITYAEYFFDTDPGFGSGTIIAITPGVNLSNVSFVANTNALPDGNHKLFIRSLDDWSITNYSSFLKGAALPLHLLSFSAVGSGDNVLLTWETENEINTSHFYIEFSTNGINFSKLGEVRANNRTGRNQYSFIHLSPASDILYYRLKQIDIDGKFDYSTIARVNMKRNKQVLLYPNPATNVIQIKNTGAGEVQQIQILSTDGKTVLVFTANGSMQYDISHLKAGMYLLQLIKKDNSISVIQFEKL